MGFSVFFFFIMRNEPYDSFNGFTLHCLGFGISLMIQFLSCNGSTYVSPSTSNYGVMHHNFPTHHKYLVFPFKSVF